LIAADINTPVNIVNTNAWIKPTNNSNIRNGKDANTGISAATITNKTSPANTFPNKRKENERIFANSEIISNNPNARPMGLLILMNFVPYLNPKCLNPYTCIKKTETKASANVVLRSAVGARNSGMCSDPSLINKLPTPGINPNQFENNMKKKKAPRSGKKTFILSFMREPSKSYNGLMIART
jgi:hypothetical protein